MSPAIVVERLSKRYNLGQLFRPTMLRDAIVNQVKSALGKPRKSREHIWAINNISFEIEPGEVVGIIGRNGAGKSTLLKLLSRITYPTMGEILVGGRLSSLLEVGTGFHEEMTGKENIYLNGSIMGMSRGDIDRRMDEIVEFSGVGRFLDTPIKRYSTGMKLRLGFGVAAHLEPDILLVDEVLAVGDVQFQRKCLAKLNDLNRGGRTVLFVSHNLGAIGNLCDRTIWIDHGEIREDGPTAEVIRQYLSSYAQIQAARVDFSDLSNRRGNGMCRITGVEFLDKEGHPKELIQSGDALVSRVSYRVIEQLQEPHFGFQLSTVSGQLITNLSTWSLGPEIPFLPPGCGSIDFTIDFLNLMPGEYYLTLWIKAVGPVYIDILEDCVKLQVEKSDFYDSGRGIDSKFGLVFFPAHWKSPSHSQQSTD